MAPHVKHNPDAAVNNIMPIPEKKNIMLRPISVIGQLVWSTCSVLMELVSS